MDSSYDNGGQDVSNIPGVKPGMIAGGSDGIVLDNSGNSERSKRGFLITGIVLIVVALIAGVVAVIVMNMGNNGLNVDEEIALNDAMRYMVFGDTEDDGKVESVELDDTFFMQVAKMWIYEKQKDYFSVLKEYLGGVDGSLKSLVLNVDLFEKMSAVAYTDVIWNAYMTGGATAVQDYLSELEGLEVSEALPVDIMETVEELGEVSIKIYDVYKKAGCLQDGETDRDCLNQVASNNSSLTGMDGEAASLRIKIRNNIETLGGQILANVKALNGIEEKVVEGVVKND